jgi:hypothetical protein
VTRPTTVGKQGWSDHLSGTFTLQVGGDGQQLCIALLQRRNDASDLCGRIKDAWTTDAIEQAKSSARAENGGKIFTGNAPSSAGDEYKVSGTMLHLLLPSFLPSFLPLSLTHLSESWCSSRATTLALCSTASTMSSTRM